jgi:hypothetical protein
MVETSLSAAPALVAERCSPSKAIIRGSHDEEAMTYRRRFWRDSPICYQFAKNLTVRDITSGRERSQAVTDHAQ